MNDSTEPSGLFASDTGPTAASITDWTDLGREMWAYLTGRGAAVNYTFDDMTVEVPRDTGADSPRAVWKFDGTLQITTSEEASSDRA